MAGRDKGFEAGDALVLAFDQATRGDAHPLFALLCRGSRLPGPQPNLDLMESFARLCAARGQKADLVIEKLTSLDADEAPGGTELEYLPMCGVAALGARGAHDEKARATSLARLHDLAEDLRFRVRDGVPLAVARIGAAAGAALLDDLEPWMDGYFHAAAVARALAEPAWLAKLHDAEAPLARLDGAFTLLREAPRAASRYPGHKALIEALSRVPSLIAPRFGSSVFDLLAQWATSKDPALREVVAANLKGSKLRARFATDVKRVEAALAGSEKAPRDPTQIVHGTRKRGGGRRR